MSSCVNCFSPIRKNDSFNTCKACKGAFHLGCNSGEFCDMCSLTQTSTTLGEIVLPDVIRRSHIELYRSCPYSFYLEVIKGQASPDTVYTRLGVDVHDIIEAYQREPFKVEELVSRFAQQWKTYPEEWFEDDAFREKMWKRALKSFDTYMQIHPTLPALPKALEQKIIFPIAEGMPQVSITMDRVDMVDGMLELHDWKTGKVMVGKKLLSDLQAPLYIHAVREHFGMDVRSFTYYYLNEEKERVFVQKSPDEYVCTVGKKEYVISIRESLGEVKTVFSKIKNHEFNVPNDTKGMFFTCKMCAQKANGSCQGADEQAWNNAKGGWAL